MTAGRHIIHSVCFETETANESTAHEFADCVRKMDCEVLFEEVLSQYDQYPGTYRIDSLTLDLGIIDAGDMESWRNRITDGLRDILEERIMMPENGPSKIYLIKDNRLELATSVQDKLEILLHYLRTGSVHWFISERPDMEALFIEVMETATGNMVYIGDHLDEPWVIERMATVFSAQTIFRFAQLFIPDTDVGICRKMTDIISTPIAGRKATIDHTIIVLRALSAVRKNGISYHESYIKLMGPFISANPVEVNKQVETELGKLIAGTAGDTTFKTIVERVRSQIGIELKRKTSTPIKDTSQKEIMSDALDKSSDKQRPAHSDYAMNDDASTCYIDNAGIVLINGSLLQRGFQELGWIKNKLVVDEVAQHKMIAWLDYLVWGEHKIHEYGLALNKVLLGLQPIDICDIHIELTAGEKQEADELLLHVIQYWSALKNTSIDGLRQTFLQRNGRLSQTDGGWQLHVEAKTVDILIERLPWAYSIMKLPWMQQPIFTQWQ